MTSASGSFFVDANILVYAAVEDDPRHGAAKALLEDPNRGSIYISAQIVTEFFSTITFLFFPFRLTFRNVSSLYSRPAQ